MLSSCLLYTPLTVGRPAEVQAPWQGMYPETPPWWHRGYTPWPAACRQVEITFSGHGKHVNYWIGSWKYSVALVCKQGVLRKAPLPVSCPMHHLHSCFIHTFMTTHTHTQTHTQSLTLSYIHVNACMLTFWSKRVCFWICAFESQCHHSYSNKCEENSSEAEPSPEINWPPPHPNILIPDKCSFHIDDRKVIKIEKITKFTSGWLCGSDRLPGLVLSLHYSWWLWVSERLTWTRAVGIF